MAELSPAAQAVLDAFCVSEGGIYLEGDPERIAAALRAAANEVAAVTTEPNRSINIEPERDIVFIGAWHIWNTMRTTHKRLFAIANELENING